jgi:hypothetical protein
MWHTMWNCENFEPTCFVDYGRKKFNFATSAKEQVNTFIPSNACGHQLTGTNTWN